MERKEFDFEIKEHLGLLTADATQTVRKELNLVSWNGKEPVYEIRGWKYHDNETKALKGITLSKEELKALKSVLNGLELE